MKLFAPACAAALCAASSLAARAQAPSLTGPAAALQARRPSPFAAPPIVRRGPLRIDTDGLIGDLNLRRRVIVHDRWHQDDTALHLDDGALDPTVVPYIVLPRGYHGARMGDLARVTYAGRTAWAICGDRGPRRGFGEGSVALAQRLGIDTDGTAGGVDGGALFEIFPGSARFAPRTQEALISYLWRLELGLSAY